MSQKETQETKVTKKQKRNWQTVREISLWFIIAISVAFIAGMQVGHWETMNDQTAVQAQAQALVTKLK